MREDLHSCQSAAKGGKAGWKKVFPGRKFCSWEKKKEGWSGYENQQNLSNRLFLSSSSVQPIEA